MSFRYQVSGVVQVSGNRLQPVWTRGSAQDRAVDRASDLFDDEDPGSDPGDAMDRGQTLVMGRLNTLSRVVPGSDPSDEDGVQSNVGRLPAIFAEVFLQLIARTLVVTRVAVWLREHLRILGGHLILEEPSARNRTESLT